MQADVIYIYFNSPIVNYYFLPLDKQDSLSLEKPGYMRKTHFKSMIFSPGKVMENQ